MNPNSEVRRRVRSGADLQLPCSNLAPEHGDWAVGALSIKARDRMRVQILQDASVRATSPGW